MKLETIKVSGGEYAKVSTRIKQFREDCPNGQIKTEWKTLGDQIYCEATVRKSYEETSASANGSAFLEKKGQKAMEKTESIAIGRALAILGYLASGEIASSEEMEEYLESVKEKREAREFELLDIISEAKSLEELKNIYGNLTSSELTETIKKACTNKKLELK